MVLGQPGEGRLDVEADVRAVDVVAWVDRLRAVERDDRAAAPELVEACVDDDAMQPGRYRRVAAEGVGPPKRRDEGFLNAVRGELSVTGGPQRDRPHPVAMAPEDLVEGGRVAGDVSGQERGVRALLTHRRRHGVSSGRAEDRDLGDLGAISGDGALTVTAATPVTARYVVLWITNPANVGSGQYRAEVSEVAVLGAP